MAKSSAAIPRASAETLAHRMCAAYHGSGRAQTRAASCPHAASTAAPGVRERRSDRKAEANPGRLARKTANADGKAGRTHGDRACIDRHRARIAHHLDCSEDAIEVGHRLAHALEHDAMDAISLGRP